MKTSNLTARQLFEELKKNPTRPRFGFGNKPILINIDLQNSYTLTDKYATAYQTDENQLDYVNKLTQLFRENKLPVVWTYVAYMESGEDCGVWGTRTDTPDSLQNIKVGSERSKLDARLDVDYVNDIVINKRMASAFFETHLRSLMVWHQCDSVILTGGSTSGCVRATAIDAISNGYKVSVVEECVADKHESPHFANLYDMAIKYADIVSYQKVYDYLVKKGQA
ncbi:N-carbamoylsarcosine amidase [Oligella ureolytica]|uniref:Isochorismatase family protein n=1 Tax=Oligella ureolytica TaxID=90244 RepID=A0A378XBD7_9BURK|nr:isochorismatase family protein [Oligella ureolytica]QPT40385.1 isochorismatase family protein [Oligella ureolytica]SUA50918.1 N-carbamoylsarcosine amidase [Oligella ureolytica]